MLVTRARPGMSGFSGSACLRALAWSPVCASVLVVGDDAGVVRVYSFNLSSVSGGSGSDGEGEGVVRGKG